MARVKIATPTLTAAAVLVFCRTRDLELVTLTLKNARGILQERLARQQEAQDPATPAKTAKKAKTPLSKAELSRRIKAGQAKRKAEQQGAAPAPAPVPQGAAPGDFELDPDPQPVFAGR